MPESKPLFDETFQQRQRARAAALEPVAPCALLREAQARLEERLGEVKKSFVHVQFNAPFSLQKGRPSSSLRHPREGGDPDGLSIEHGVSEWRGAFQRHRSLDPHLRGDDAVIKENNASPDLILSCLELQSVNDLPGTLARLRETLAEDGLFHAVMAGGETLRELRHALAEAETALCGGASPRVAPMIDLGAAGRLLLEAGFALPVADSERITLIYPDLFALMRDLRAMGWTNALSQRPRRFAPRRLFEEAARTYAARFPAPEGQGVTVTVDLIFLHGWKG